MIETPSTPAAPISARARVAHFLAGTVRDAAKMALALLIVGTLAFILIEPKIEAYELKRLHDEQVAFEMARDGIRRIDHMSEDLDAMRDGIMVPPTNDKMFGVLSQGLGVTEDIYKTDDVGTTPEAAFATDLTTNQQSSAYTQECLIQNTHGSQNLCVKPIAWSGVTTCTALCAASGYTCSAAATDGWRLVAGQAMEFRWDGTVCACVVGSGATTNYQTRRAVR